MAAEEPRWMTAAEEKAVRKVERAIKALPKSIALYFHGENASVMDCDSDGIIVGVAESGSPAEPSALASIRTRRCAAGDF